MSEYIAITGKSLLEDSSLEFDLYLKSGSNGHSKYVLFCRGQDGFSQERKEELLSRNIDNLYIAAEDTGKYLRYQENNLTNIVNDESKSTKEKSGVVYQVARNLISDLMDDPKSGEGMERVSGWVQNTVSHIMEDENTFSSLFDMTSHDYHIYTHSINVSAIGLLFGKYLDLEPHELNRIGSGLLLHDIGKTTIPMNVINKPGHLSGDDLTAIRKHPKAGLELLEHMSSVNVLSLKIVIQHHENYDGSGYPYGMSGNELHLFSRIARIIDTYDAMTSKKAYADAKRPFAVLAEMKNDMPGCFDMELLREFIGFLGPKDPRKERRPDDTLYSTASMST
jgi:HD-GYP domain-containing protein (c-di-GMP phosphodiesterase class II)